MEPNETPFRPPYLSFQTYWSFLEELCAKPLPPQIDRSLMGSKSGTDQLNLNASLTAFGLVGPGGVVKAPLVELHAADEDARPEWLAKLIRTYYPAVIAVAESNGTEQQLNTAFVEAFDLKGADTRRKSVTFFLHAARKAGIPLSPHFPQTRGGSGAPGTPGLKRIKRKSAGAGDKATAATNKVTPPTPGDTYSVSLSSGGEVSVVVNVNLFGLSTDDRNFVIELVDKLKGYPVVTPTSQADLKGGVS